MKCAVLLVVLFLVSSMGSTKVVTNDRGGRVLDRIIEVSELRADGVRVMILGRCDSACTLYLSLPNTCAGRRARLGFHAASRPWATRYLMSRYPKGVRAWIEKNGGLSTRLIVLRGKELKRLVPSCEEAPLV